MADRYQALTSNPVGTFLAKNLGLPNPPRLRRYSEGDPLVSGAFLVGGDGRLSTAAAAIDDAGGSAHSQRAEGTRYQGLVFDASTIKTVDGLVALHDFFTPVLRSLAACPHVVVLGMSSRGRRLPGDAHRPAGPRRLHPLARQGDRPWRHRAARLRRGGC